MSASDSGRLGSSIDALLLRLDRLVQRVVPPRADQVAWLSEPDYVGNAFHLHRHARTTRTGLRHVWLVRDGAARARIDADIARHGDPGDTIVVRRHSLRGYWERTRSSRIFHTHGVFPMDRAVGREVVSLWHGMPIKGIGYLNTASPNPHPTFATVHLATSVMFRTIIAGSFRARPDEVLLTALPRTDVLVGPHPAGPTATDVAAALDVDGPLVLWLPTHRARRSDPDALAGPAAAPSRSDIGVATFLDDVDAETWNWIDDAAAAVGATVVVKLHPDDPLNQSDGVPAALEGRRAIRLVRSDEWLATGFELYDVLAHAVALVSDISSVLIDFLVTDRPIAMVGFDEERYDRDLVVPIDVLRRSRRLHHFDDRAIVDEFFERAVGQRGADVDDLSSWLVDVAPGSGCETVLRAVGL